jgi:predicted MFS family arabinose efflux permease
MEDSQQVISPQQAEERVAARYRVFLFLWIAILTSMSILFALALFLPSSGSANETLSFALLGTAFVTVVASLFIKQQMVKKAIDQQQVAVLMNAYIISFALSESAALFGLLDHFVSGSGYYRFSFIMAAIGMLLHFPKKEHVRAASFKQF